MKLIPPYAVTDNGATVELSIAEFISLSQVYAPAAPSPPDAPLPVSTTDTLRGFDASALHTVPPTEPDPPTQPEPPV